MTNPYLERIQKRRKTDRIEVLDKVFIGRSCKGIDEARYLIVSDPLVSRDHAVVSWDGSRLEITDISKNGTWVNSVRMTPGLSRELKEDDIIRVGQETIKVAYRLVVPLPKDNDGITAIKTEQVVVSNLVVDVRGFSGISQRESSSKVYAAIRNIFDAFSAIVVDYKGTIKDYAGDAVYAFWDHRFTPSAEQAILACRAAMEQARNVSGIREKLSEENETFANLSLGWGITTGEITMSHYGSRAAGMAILGDCTNLAFRLSDIANKHLSSEIAICSQTAKLVKETLPVRDLGLVSIRGRSGQENVYGIEWK